MRIIGRETLMNAVSVGKAATAYSNSMDFTASTGEVAVLLTSTAGNISVSQQCSINGKDWYDPANSGGATVGWVSLQQTSTTGRWLVYTPVLGTKIRYKVVENNVAATVVTLVIIFQEAGS
jgi:hypothetical protein